MSSSYREIFLRITKPPDEETIVQAEQQSPKEKAPSDQNKQTKRKRQTSSSSKTKQKKQKINRLINTENEWESKGDESVQEDDDDNNNDDDNDDDEERTTTSTHIDFSPLEQSTMRRLEALYGLWDRKIAAITADSLPTDKTSAAPTHQKRTSSTGIPCDSDVQEKDVQRNTTTVTSPEKASLLPQQQQQVVDAVVAAETVLNQEPVRPPVHPMVLLNPHIPASQLPHYRPPPKPREKRQRRTPVHGDDSFLEHGENNRDSEEEIKPEKTEQEKKQEEKRRRRKQLQYIRQQEWNQIRRNWQRRNVDYRNEIDVGGAIMAAVKHNYRPEIHKSSAEKTLTRDRESIINDDNVAKVDSQQQSPLFEAQEEEKEEEEIGAHGQVLKRLLGGEQGKSKEESEGESESEQAENFEPYKTRLDYWGLGKSYPDVDASLYKPAALLKLPPSSISQPNNTCQQDKYPGLQTTWSLRHMGNDPTETRKYGASPLPTRATARIKYQHERQILRLAATYLVGSSRPVKSKQSAVADKMLRSLWDPSLLQASWHSIVDRQTALCGMRVVKFLASFMEDPAKKMEKLKMTHDIDLFAPRANENVLKTLSSEYFSKSKHRTDTLMRTSSNYAAAPGTCPPSPHRPLISLGFEFGLTDRFSYVWHREMIPIEALKMTLSTLFTRWLSETGEEKKADLEHQMSTMMEHSVRLNDSKLGKKLAWQEHPVEELPLFQLYQSMMTFSSLMANNGGQSFEAFSGTAAGKIGHGSGLHATAHQLFDFLDPSIQLQGLKAFPAIHLIFALLCISTGLPEEAVSILAGAVNKESTITPFNIIRDVLEYVEGESLLLEHRSPEGGIEVGKLEYLFFLASESVLRCLEADPSEPEYHSWYVAIKAGSLLLCSGIRIGGGAVRFPSASRKRDSNAFLMETIGMSKTKDADLEIRAKLHTFDKTRYETAKAVQILLNLSKIQDSSRCHRALASFLEWRQAVALLVGDSEDANSHFDEIRQNHYEFSQRWAELERSSTALEYLKRNDDLQSVLKVLADCLEQNPDDITAWRSLIRALGPVQKPESSKCEAKPPLSGSQKAGEIGSPPTESGAIASRSNYDVPGERQPDLQGKVLETPYWVAERLSWWSHEMLHISLPTTEMNRIEFMISHERPREMFTLKNQLKASLEHVHAEKLGGYDDTTNPTFAHPVEEMEWLKVCLRQKTSKSTASSVERMKTYDHVLPQPLEVTLNRIPEVDFDSLGTCFGLLKDVSTQVQGMCYKLVLRRHLYGPCDGVVANTIKYLIFSCWNAKNTSVTTPHAHIHALQWLHSMGIDVLSVIPDVDPPDPRTRAEKTWPHEMRAVVLEHAAKHGTGSWKTLMDNHPAIFAGTHRSKARQCYIWMKKKGLV